MTIEPEKEALYSGDPIHQILVVVLFLIGMMAVHSAAVRVAAGIVIIFAIARFLNPLFPDREDRGSEFVAAQQAALRASNNR